MQIGRNSTPRQLRKIGIPTTPNHSVFSPTPRVVYFSNFVVTHGRLTMSGMRTGRSFSKVSALLFVFFFCFDIFPGVCGKLECEDGIVRASIQHSLCSWCHVEQQASGPNQSSLSNNCVSVEKWIHELRQALLLQNPPNVKIRIRKCTEPTRGCSCSDSDEGSTETFEGPERILSHTRGESTSGNGVAGSDEGRTENLERPEGVSSPTGRDWTRGNGTAVSDEGSTKSVERLENFSSFTRGEWIRAPVFSPRNLSSLLVCLLSILVYLYFVLLG